MKSKFLFISLFLASISLLSLVGTEKVNNLAQTISSSGFDSTLNTEITESPTSSGGGSTSGSNSNNTYTYTVAPSEITGFIGVMDSCGSGKINLSWPSVSFAERYKLYRESAVVYEGNNTNFTDSGLSSGVLYHYKLVAMNSYGYSYTLAGFQSPPPCQTSTETTNTTNNGSTGTETTSGSSEPTTSTNNTTTDTTTTSAGTTTYSDSLAYTLYLNVFPGPCDTGYVRLSWEAVSGTYGYKVSRDDKVVYTGRDLQFYSSGLEAGRSYRYLVVAYRLDGSPLAKTTATITAPQTCPKAIESGTNTSGVSNNTGETESVTKTETQTTETISTQKTYTTEVAPVPLTTQTAPTAPTIAPTIKTTTTQTNCDFTKQYLKRSTNTCLPRSYCADEKNPEFTSIECQEIRKYDIPTGVPTSEVANTTTTSNIVEISEIFKESRLAQEKAMIELNRLIDEKIAQGLSRVTEPNIAQKRLSLEDLRNRLKEKIRSVLLKGLVMTGDELNSLKKDIETGLGEIRTIISVDMPKAESDTNLEKVITDLAEVRKNHRETLEQTKGALVFQDSNNDGISDYDATHVFKIDPKENLPTSDYENRKIGPEEKILLGFDPTREELVKISYEEPVASWAPIVETYEVKEIKLTEEKKVVISGEALPNSFVTIYIYSTPIIVTVKTDSNGVWQYTLDKELDDGEHTIYTATVDNGGKIVARSSGVPFVKTAEAATLGPAIVTETTGQNKNINLFLIVVIFVSLLALSVLLIGYMGNVNKVLDETTPSDPQRPRT